MIVLSPLDEEKDLTATTPKIETAKKPLPRLTVEQIRAYKRAAPLSETFDMEEVGGSIQIQGIATKAQYDAIQAEIIRLSKLKSLKATLGYQPASREIVQACYIAANVDDPKMTAIQWLVFAKEAFTSLSPLFDRVLICSRMASDIDDSESEDAEIKPKDGIETAKDRLKDGDEADPLASGGGGADSAVAN